MATTREQTNKTDKKITRCFNFNIEAREDKEGKKGIIEGRAIVYDSPTDLGWFTEVIEKGALKKTDLKDVRFLVNHDTRMIPLARSRNNNENSTMQLFVDDEGLRIRVVLDIENNSDARNLYSAVKRGDITGMSFMFIVDGEEWEDEDTEHPTRRIKSISIVYEVSAVTFPAYEETEINARCKEELESYRSTLESVQNRLLESRGDDDKLQLLKLKNQILGGIG